MPLLKRESELQPDNLFDLTLEMSPWWIAHVRSRQEKALCRYVSPLGIPYYLPQIENKIRRSGRTFRSYLPLFSGYVFLRGLFDTRQRALRSNVIVQILEVADQELLTRELSQIRVLQKSGASLKPATTILPGDSVRITEGPFKGYEGVVLREKGKLNLVVMVSALRRVVAVELDREWISNVFAPVFPRQRSRTSAA